MVAMNVVKTVTVVGRQQGVEQVTASLGAQEVAFSRLLAAVAANDRATLSAGRALERHSVALDQGYRGAQKLAQITEDLNRAQAQGLVTAERVNQLLAAAALRYGAVSAAATTSATAVQNSARGWQFFSTGGLRDLQNETASKRLTEMGSSAAVAGKGARLATHEMVNLGYQLNDIGTMLAMGQSPFMILASQGGQVAQIFATMEKSSRAAVMGFLTNPIVLATAGIMTAAGAAYLYFRDTESGIEKTDQALEGHASLIRSLKDAYGDAAIGLRDYARESDAVLKAKAQDNLRTIRDQMQAQATAALPSMGRTIDAGPAGQVFAVDHRLEAFRKQIVDFEASVNAKRPAILQFRAAIASIATANPNNENLQRLAAELTKATEQGAKLEQGLPAAEDAIKATNAAALAGANAMKSYSDGMGKLVDMVPRLKQASGASARFVEIAQAHRNAVAAIEGQRANGDLNAADYSAELANITRARDEALAAARAAQATALSPMDGARRDHELEMRAIRARTAQERADLAAARKERELAGKNDISPAERALAVENAWTQELTRAKHDLAEVDRERGMALSEQFAAARAELALSGASIASIEAERFRREKLAEVERLALTNGEAWAKRQRAAINDLANEWGELQEMVARTSAAQDVAFDRAQALRSERERRIYSDLRGRRLLQNGEVADPATKQLADEMRAVETLRAQVDLTRSLAFERQQLRRTEEERAIYSEMRGAGLLDESGEISGAYNKAIAEQMRWNRTIEDGQKAVQGLGRELIDAAKAGDVQGMISAPAKRAEEFLTDRIAKGFDNSIQTLMADLAGEGPLADMFAKSTPLGSSAANPMFVSVVGGAGLPGLAGGAANDVPGGVKVNGPGGITRAPLSRMLETNDNRPAANAAPFSSAIARAAGTAGGGSMSFVGNYRRGVDPRLTEILNEAATRSGLKVEAFSGFRPGDTRFHGKGLATDVRLFDQQTGKPLPNYQNAQSFRAYEQFAQQARMVQMERYPGLSQDFRWGGYFGGGRGKYGALDTMHFDLGGRRAGMGGGSWEGGLTPAQRRLWPGAQSQGMNFSAAQPAAQLQSSFTQLQAASEQAATTIPAMSQQAAQAASGLGGLGQQASGLGGLFQNLLGMGGAPMGGAGGAGGGGGLLSMLMTTFGLPGFSEGGPTGSTGGVVHPHEYVVNAPTTRALGGPAGVERALREQPMAMPMAVPIVVPAALPPANQNAPKTEVHVHNNGSGKVSTQETTDSRGNRRVDVVVDEMQANAAMRPGSATARANQSAYGLSPALKRR